MKTIILSNHKGGCAKTTSALCIAQTLVKMGFRVLAIDMDPQGNMTLAMTADRFETTTISDILLEKADPTPIKTQQGIDFFPSGFNMSGNELEIKKELQHETLLKRFLDDMDTSSYDYCVIDCPPNLGTYTILGLMAADDFYIPLQPEFFGTSGLVDIVRFTERVKKFNKNLNFGGIFVTRTHPNDKRKLVKGLITKLKNTYPEHFLDVYIRESVSIPESQYKRVSIFEHDPESNAARDYENLVEKMLQTVNA